MYCPNLNDLRLDNNRISSLTALKGIIIYDDIEKICVAFDVQLCDFIKIECDLPPLNESIINVRLRLV